MNWSRVARRIRVPLGFAFAVLYIWLAWPTWRSIVLGILVAAIGIVIRALASGYVKKNDELTTTGPYAYSRNPLYVGSMVIGAGRALKWRASSYRVPAVTRACCECVLLPAGFSRTRTCGRKGRRTVGPFHGY